MSKSEFFNTQPIDLDFENRIPDFTDVIATADQAIEKNIVSDQIKSTILKDADETDFKPKAYLIDLSEVSNITEQSLESINALLIGGDVAVYIKYGDATHIIGTSQEDLLFRLLPPLLRQLYTNSALLYVLKNNQFRAFDSYDVNIITFNLR